MTVSTDNDALSVNDLITSLRKIHFSALERRPELASVTRTLPPQIQRILNLPETPGPAARGARRRYDASGRLLPPGPIPRSWIEQSQRARVKSAEASGDQYPNDINHLPGIVDHVSYRGKHVAEAVTKGKGRDLQDMCLRTMAAHWEFIETYERNNLADLPTRLRMSLLSNIAVYGPEHGVHLDGLKTIILPPPNEEFTRDVDAGTHNAGFFRLDLSGSVGRLVSLRQITELVETPIQSGEETEYLSWENSLTRTLCPPIPHLTHLSLSHPGTSISWPRLLKLAKHIPTLTHLSLAFWPTPSLTPNANTTVMDGGAFGSLQYGGTNYYSHSLDNDFRESATILHNLADLLYSLEYLDLTGCLNWLRALRWQEGVAGIDWFTQWPKLRQLKLHTGLELSEESELSQVESYVKACQESAMIQIMMPQVRRRGGKNALWVDILRDGHEAYDDFWRSFGLPNTETDTRRVRLDVLKHPDRHWQLTDWQRMRANGEEEIHEADGW